MTYPEPLWPAWTGDEDVPVSQEPLRIITVVESSGVVTCKDFWQTFLEEVQSTVEELQFTVESLVALLIRHVTTVISENRCEPIEAPSDEYMEESPLSIRTVHVD